MMFDALAFAAVQSPAEPTAEDAPDKADLRLMSEIGVTAIALGRGEAAQPIFEMVSEAQPDNAAGPVCLALAELSAGRIDAAAARLRAALRERNRCLTEAKAVLCLLLSQTGKTEEARRLRAEILRGPDSGAKRMVAALWR